MNGTDIGIDYLSGLEVLGRGGFSVVYSAMDTRFDRRVAVKVLRPFGSESERKMFRRECRAMGRLSSHRNVVTLYEAGFAADESPFMIMELVEGGSLEDLLEQRGPIPWSEAVGYVAQAAEAVEHAHRADVLHRDVKPANILVADDGAKLTDFGISGLGVSGDTSSVNVAASWMHSPPETFPNKRDARSDIYALGSTLYTLIVGTPPLWQSDSDGIETIMYRVLHEVPPVIPDHLAPTELRHLVARTLAKSPEERPQTAGRFLAELHSVTNGANGGGATNSTTSDTVTVGPPVVQPGEPGPSVENGRPGAGLPEIEPPRSSKPVVPVVMASVLALALGGGALAMTTPWSSNPAASDASEVLESATSSEDLAGPTTTISSTTTGQTEATPVAATPAETTTTLTAPTTASSTTVVETTRAATVSAPPLFAGTIAQAPGDADSLISFLEQHPQEVVELDLELFLGENGFFPADSSGGPTVLFGGSGYSLRFLEQNDGTSGLFFVRGSNYRISGYFSVGELFGPNQGILTQAIDPVAPEVALASGG